MFIYLISKLDLEHIIRAYLNISTEQQIQTKHTGHSFKMSGR